MRLLTRPLPPASGPIHRPRTRRYGPAVQAALVTAWAAAPYICAKRLVPFFPELVAALERHGHRTLPDTVRTDLLALRSATADQVLRQGRQQDHPRGMRTTKVGAPGERIYAQAPPPLRRRLATGCLSGARRQYLNDLAILLDRVRLLRQFETLQDALWQPARFQSQHEGHTVPDPAALAQPPALHFQVAAWGLQGAAMEVSSLHGRALRLPIERAKRAYRRPNQQQGPRTYRTRPDPFAHVWHEVGTWLTPQPERTGQSVCVALHQR